MRIDICIKYSLKKATSPDGQYIGTEVFLIDKLYATPTILNGFKSNQSPVCLYEPLQMRIDFIADYIKEHPDTYRLTPKNVKCVEMPNMTYHVAEIAEGNCIFFNAVYTKHLFANGFTICCPYINGTNLVGIMKKNKIVGILAPMNVSPSLLQRAREK